LLGVGVPVGVDVPVGVPAVVVVLGILLYKKAVSDSAVPVSTLSLNLPSIHLRLASFFLSNEK
jgi:hypothetical protein